MPRGHARIPDIQVINLYFMCPFISTFLNDISLRYKIISCALADGLDRTKEYEFRIKAKNPAGLSEPSQPTSLVQPKAKPSK